MKLFGKKTLAMILSIAMVLSVCSVSVFADNTATVAVGGKTTLSAASEAGSATVTWETGDSSKATVVNGEVTGIAGGSTTITAKWTPESGTEQTKTWTVTVTVPVAGVTLDKATASIKVKETVKLTASIDPTDATNKAVTWESSDSTIATVGSDGVVTGVKPGTAIITATTADGGKTASCEVTVSKATIVSATGTVSSSNAVPKGATEAKVKAKISSATITARLNAADGATVSLSSSDLNGTWTVTYDSTNGRYVCTSAVKADHVLYESAAVTVYVPAATNYTLPNMSITCIIDGDGDTADTYLENRVYSAIKDALGKDPASFTLRYQDVSLGEIDSDGDYEVSLDYDEEEELYEKGYLTDEFSYSTTVSDVTYSGKVTLTFRTTDVSETFTYAGGSLSSIASTIDALLGGQMEAIEFEEIDLEGGVLWADNKFEEEVYEDEYYTPSEMADMIYLPNGSGEASYLSYVAYDDYDADDGEVDDDADYIEGTIMLYADEFLLLSANITSEEVVELDGATFEDAFLDLDSDYEYLDYVTFTKPSSSDGYLYVEYDEDDNKHTSIGGSTKYYVEDDDKALIDEITYVPGKNTEGVVTIRFKAVGYDDDEKKVTVNGVMQITVAVAADITIQAGKEQTVEIDPDLFLEYIEDVDTSNKDLEIVSVAITGAPYQAKKGYLVTDGDELTKSGVKTFYADEDDVDVDKKKYDLFDLSFLGGEKDNTVNATFKVTYLREGSTSKRYAEGTIDFVTGAAAAGNTMNGTIRAAETMSFGETVTLNAFEELGGNNNEYIVFTSLPVGGKLVYNWGKSNQEDVKVGTEYWLSAKSGKKLMSNVTFVPSYSSSKVQKTVTIGVKGYNEKDRATTGTINITINYAAYSSKFYDITTSTYADSVDFLANQGITTGMTATTFGPNNNVTRAQFVTFLWRAAGSPSVTGVTNKFTDVKSTGTYAYAYQAILWAVQNNITTGRTATTFAPAANVTHQELLTFLYRYDVNYLKHSGTTSSYVSYTDYSSVSSYAQVPVKWADYKGILSGYTIQPTVAGTRATVALWLHRMLTL